MKEFDICVIGAGPGGYVAAIRAGQLGAKVALVEKDYVGGTCLNWGCIPTKSLIASAEVFKKIKNAHDFGVKISGDVKADWSAMMERKNKIVEKLRGGIATLLKGAGVELIEGVAKFASKKEVEVSTKGGDSVKIRAERFIIACGCEPAYPSFIPRSDRIMTSTEMLEIKELPESLVILGGGVIGCEFACMFAELGVQVTILEMLPEILSVCDKEVIKYAVKEMKSLGISIETDLKVEKVKISGDKVVCVSGEDRYEASHMLVAVGRKSVVSRLEIDRAGLKADEKGFIRVDSRCRTEIPGIYAIGDVTGRIQLAHLASAMGICAAENACGRSSEFRDDLVPNCIFTSPEIGSVGLTEEECKAKGIKYKVGKFSFVALGKALAIGESGGFCKVIADEETDQVKGVHIIGPHATDLIAEAATAMNMEVTAIGLGRAIHAHPTLAEAIMEAAHDLHGECIHAPIKKKKS